MCRAFVLLLCLVVVTDARPTETETQDEEGPNEADEKTIGEPRLWTETKFLVLEESDPEEYFPPDEDFIVVVEQEKPKPPVDQS